MTRTRANALSSTGDTSAANTNKIDVRLSQKKAEKKCEKKTMVLLTKTNKTNMLCNKSAKKSKKKISA